MNNDFGQASFFGLEYSSPVDKPVVAVEQPVTLRSGSPHWCTPLEIAQLLDQFGPVALDPFSNQYSLIRAAQRVMPPQNSLLLPWDQGGLIFANPPYGDDLEACALKIGTEARKSGREIITLVPARCDTDWWQNHLDPELWIAVTHRLRFLEPVETLRARFEARAAEAKRQGKMPLKPPRIHMITDQLAEGESATFPSALVYHGKRKKQFIEVFGHLGLIYKKDKQHERRKKWEKARDAKRTRVRKVGRETARSSSQPGNFETMGQAAP